MGDNTRGLYGKFNVERRDGKSAKGEKHDGCEYFVLDLNHDKHAIPALQAYAISCQDEFPLLAQDLMAFVRANTSVQRTCLQSPDGNHHFEPGESQIICEYCGASR